MNLLSLWQSMVSPFSNSASGFVFFAYWMAAVIASMLWYGTWISDRIKTFLCPWKMYGSNEVSSDLGRLYGWYGLASVLKTHY